MYFLVVRYFRELRLFCSQEEEQTDDDEESGKEITNANNSNKAEPVQVPIAANNEKDNSESNTDKKDLLKKEGEEGVLADKVCLDTFVHSHVCIHANRTLQKGGEMNPENTTEATEPKAAKLAAPQETADKAEPSDAPQRYEVTFQHIHKPSMPAAVSCRLHWRLVPIACVHCFPFFSFFITLKSAVGIND